MSVTDRARSGAPATIGLEGSAPSRLHGLGLAALRVTMGLVWLNEAWWKIPPNFGVFRSWVERPLEFPVFEPYNWVVEAVILPNFHVFAWLTYLTEATLAGFLIVGLATRAFALLGALWTVPIMLSVWNYSVTDTTGTTLSEWGPAYVMMAMIHVALAATAAGRFHGVDGALRDRWRASRSKFARLLAWAS